MQTSRSHAVLFTKEGCGPCEETKEFVFDLLEHNLSLTETLSFMKKENHSALVESYKLDCYPTLLIVGPSGLLIDKVIGGASIRDCIESKLTEIYRDSHS